MVKPTIAVDLDDVLAQHVEAFVAFSNAKYGTTLTKDQYDEHWANLWQVDHDEIERRAKEFHTSDSFLEYGKLEDAEPVLRHLATTYTLYIVTARVEQAVAGTYGWLEKHFGGVFSGVHFVPIWEPDNTVTKADICKQIGAGYLIDDAIRHCNVAAESGIKALLFGDYNWNKGEVAPEIVRVKDWRAVKEYFDGR